LNFGHIARAGTRKRSCEKFEEGIRWKEDGDDAHNGVLNPSLIEQEENDETGQTNELA
jgi:hypothetical protein